MMITLKNVSASVNGVPVLEDMNLEVKDGEFVFVVGETGSGKSTLLRLVSMELCPTSGTILFGEFDSSTIRSKEIPFLRRKIGFLFQEARLLEDRNVFENVALPLHVAGVKNREVQERVLQALEEVQLSHKVTDMPAQLSLEEKQRAALARAFVGNPSAILADEPTGNLDPGSSLALLELMKSINSRGTSFLVATHQYELVKKVPARIVQIKNGRLLEVEVK